MTPLLNPTTPSEKKYNKSHITTRSRIEQAFGILKQRFQALKIKLRTRLDHSLTITVAIMCLHNFAIITNQELVNLPEIVVDSNSTDSSQTPGITGRAVR